MRQLRRLAVTLAGLIGAASALPAGAADAKDFSAAERAIFMTPQLGGVRPPATLRYAFHKAGSLEPGFDDRVAVTLSARPDRGCCAAATEFLSGTRQLRLPDIEAAEGNPVILYFLEHDIREMQRLTRGSQNYFRKRIRMSIYQGATLRDVSFQYRGRTVAGQEIAFSPYLDDPNRTRYPKLANKHYLFLLSDGVPGGVYGIRTRIAAESADLPPLIVEEMMLDGAGGTARTP